MLAGTVACRRTAASFTFLAFAVLLCYCSAVLVETVMTGRSADERDVFRGDTVNYVARFPDSEHPNSPHVHKRSLQ